MSSQFKDLGLSSELLEAIEDMGFEEPSPIQLLAIPVLLAGSDAIGQAQTGTGKTAAFGLPVLEKVNSSPRTQALILCPTRELAIQVAEEIGKLAAHKTGITILPIYGGQSIERQFRALKKGAQIIVGTPGRILDHLGRGTLKLSQVQILVLDEADEMLDMGFREDIENILAQTPAQSQKVLFSATMPDSIRELAKRFLHAPQMLTIAHKILTVPAVEQVYYELRPYQKLDALCRVLDSYAFHKGLVFCSTKRGVDDVTEHLQQRGYQADGLHGNMSQAQRDRVMTRFRSGGLEILVATDVAARGIDVDNVDAVLNYDIPRDVEGYVHRIGRTGRAGRAGRAFTFVTMREHYRLQEIIRYTKARITQGRLPSLRDVSNMCTSRLFEEVMKTLESGSLQRWLELIEDFLSEHFPDGEISNRDISAAMLKMLMQRDCGNSEQVSKNDTLADSPEAPRRSGRRERPKKHTAATNRQNEAGMTCLEINVGHRNKITPGAVVGAIAGESGINGTSIGAIEIQNDRSLVDVEDSLADNVLEILNHGVFICGTKVTARKYRDNKLKASGEDPGCPRKRQRVGFTFSKKKLHRSVNVRSNKMSHTACKNN